MKWTISAKTFLLGEYVALYGGPAIILATQPGFEITTANGTGKLINIHPESPAGKWWNSKHNHEFSLDWHDPYNGCGGLGASSAQFVGVYNAWHDLNNYKVDENILLSEYKKYATQSNGESPSGYDVLAQNQSVYNSQTKCIVINNSIINYPSYTWQFKNLSFILIHTGKKLATHEHLATLKLSREMNGLKNIVETAIESFTNNEGELIIKSINCYHEELLKMNLVADHTKSIIHQLKDNLDLLAIKGCGAMGADVVCMIVLSSELNKSISKLNELGYLILTSC